MVMLRSLTVAAVLGSAQAFKIAFIGDTGAQTSGSNGYFAAALYDMMARENVDLVAQNGDLDYNRDPLEWDTFLERYAYSKGMDVLVSSGNHEELSSYDRQWYGSSGYKARMEARQRTSTLLSDCSGSYGERYNCKIGPAGNQVHIVSIGWAQQNTDEVALSTKFVEDSFKDSDAAFRVLMMHKPEGRFNPGDAHDGNYALYPLYEAARKYGAFVTSGHAHVYGRTKLMSSFSTRPTVSSKDLNDPQLVCGGAVDGTSVAFVIGCGGYKFDGDGNYAGEDYWRSTFTSSNNAPTSGALLCDFEGSKATCAFTKYDGTKLDSFVMTSDRCRQDSGSPGGSGGSPVGGGSPGGSGGSPVGGGSGEAPVVASGEPDPSPDGMSISPAAGFAAGLSAFVAFAAVAVIAARRGRKTDNIPAPNPMAGAGAVNPRFVGP